MVLGSCIIILIFQDECFRKKEQELKNLPQGKMQKI